MPKKKSLWKRETPCLVCETNMNNYQFMTKSQNIVFDEWFVAHTHPLGEYDEYPDVLKTTICPNCLTASNEYSFGVDNYKYFTRNMRKNDQIKEFFKKTMDARFRILANEISKFERESALLDRQNNRPANTRTRATFEKIWQQKDRYAVPFFTLMFSEPRDYVMALVCFAMDRYCQYLRIAFNYDIEPQSWDLDLLKAATDEKFGDKPLDMKSPEPRFFFIGTNYLQSVQFLEELIPLVPEDEQKRLKDLADEYWKDAYKAIQLSINNDDISAIPIEVKEGGMNLLMAKLHFRFGQLEQGKKNLRVAKNYADNRLKQISSKNQQNFVNEVDDLFKRYSEQEEAQEVNPA